MSFKEVTILRKSGKLKEAYQMAKFDLDAQPDNIWNKRAIAWVYYEYLKLNATPEKYNQFVKILKQIKALSLPEDEKMVFDKSAWQIGSLVFALQRIEPVDYSKIDEVFEIIKEFHFTKPSAGYSFLYKAFHNLNQNWINYIQFAEWWDFRNFREEDYEQEEFDGKILGPIVEKAYNAYSIKLLEGSIERIVDNKKFESDLKKGISSPYSMPHKEIKSVDKGKIKSFLPLLDDVIEKHPEYQYLPYYKAKLLMAVGSEENALSAFLPFAKQKRNDFWVWELMADLFSDDKNIGCCYCKALSLNTGEDFLVKIRQRFAGLLVEKQMYNEAKTEIEKIIATKKRQEFSIPKQLTQWTNQDWYKSAVAKQDNKELYARHLDKAEEFLFNDVQEEIVVVDFVNSKKKILNFIKNKEKFGSFKYSGFKPVPGDILKVRFQKGDRDGLYRALTVKKGTETDTSEALKTVEGAVKIFERDRTFGIMNNIFIPNFLVEKHKLQNGENITVKAILSFNKGKDEWGWRAVEIRFRKKQELP